ncbi:MULTISPECIES: helix-turn-helix domain-containing protein [unclassified Nocardioides]|uniref:helix-turn-helix domain-containing protein n=1 Tax=unclassified Nocardioides TaxID=2615069 RepID=UPI00138F3AC9|nr:MULTISPECIES: helix-turn-helix transcriptional regulator [unclassified Nocardioides]
MRDDLVQLSRTLDPAVLGERLRAARLRAGITQAQVAGDTMSVGYVSRIESGQRRPDPDLLERMAERLGVEVEELLVGVSPDRIAGLRVQLDHAELALRTGAAPDALESVVGLLADPALASLDQLRRDASYVHAGALEVTGDLQAAILVLEDLAEGPAADLAWIDGVTALSRCYRESGELGRAIEVGNQAARRIGELGLEGLDASIRLSLTVAAAYSEQGDVEFAARLCRRAVDRAEAMASPVATAMAYWNSSIIETLRGNAAGALPMTRQALAVLERSEDARNVARLRSQLGIHLMRVDPPEAAEALTVLLRAADELALTDAGPADLADNRLAQARARFLLGDVDTAREQATETAASTRGTAPLVAAESSVLLGQIAIHAGAPGPALAHFHEAVLLLSGVGADRAAAQVWFELGGLLEGAGDPGGALDAYRRAAAATGLVRSPGRRTADL